jgi:hypothetical protein
MRRAIRESDGGEEELLRIISAASEVELAMEVRRQSRAPYMRPVGGEVEADEVLVVVLSSVGLVVESLRVRRFMMDDMVRVPASVSWML